jgi:uncharacterized protein YdbL (DUF1318 family)
LKDNGFYGVGRCLGPAALVLVLAACQPTVKVEAPDSLAGVVTASAPAEAKAAVERVNAERMVEYNRIAAQQKTSVAAVQAIFGKKLIDQAAKGTYIMNAQGQWVKK